MKDEDLAAAVRQAFEQEALSAPGPHGLLESVLAGSRRRAIRNRVAGVSLAAVAVVGTIFGAQALPTGPGSSEIAPTAGPGPGAFAADEIDLCPVYDGDRLTSLTLTWVRPGRQEATVETTSGTLSGPAYTVRGDSYAMDVLVRRGSPARGELDDFREVTVGGRAGVVGDDPGSGDRVLSFDTGVLDTTVRLVVRSDGSGSGGSGPGRSGSGGPGSDGDRDGGLGSGGSPPGDDELLAWAEKFTVHAEPAECAS